MFQSGQIEASNLVRNLVDKNNISGNRQETSSNSHQAENIRHQNNHNNDNIYGASSGSAGTNQASGFQSPKAHFKPNLDNQILFEWPKMDSFYSLLSLTFSLAVIFGGLIPFVPQYLKIKQSENSDGFSTYDSQVCLTLLIANILRIMFWFGDHFELPLLFQSFVMIFAMLTMLEICVRMKNKTFPYHISSINGNGNGYGHSSNNGHILYRHTSQSRRRSFLGKLIYGDDQAHESEYAPIYSVLYSSTSRQQAESLDCFEDDDHDLVDARRRTTRLLVNEYTNDRRLARDHLTTISNHHINTHQDLNNPTNTNRSTDINNDGLAGQQEGLDSLLPSISEQSQVAAHLGISQAPALTYQQQPSSAQVLSAFRPSRSRNVNFGSVFSPSSIEIASAGSSSSPPSGFLDDGLWPEGARIPSTVTTTNEEALLGGGGGTNHIIRQQRRPQPTECCRQVLKCISLGFGLGEEPFWEWSKYSSYVKFLLLFTTTMGLVTYLFVDKYFYVESLGFVALMSESVLGLPQLLKNYSNKSTQGMSIFMVVMWFAGDLGKTVYFFIRKTPSQFKICGTIQMGVDLMILGQVFWYRKHHKIAYWRLPKSG